MSKASHSRLRWSLAAGCCLVAAMICAACTKASGNIAHPAAGAVRVLQLNLCDSGIATCYTGRSVAEAARVIRAERPDIVTLDEVCRGDVSVLAHALSAAASGSTVTPAFEPTPEQHGSAPVRCRNGQEYGIGLLARARPGGHTISGGHYPAQDPVDTEKRVWLCLHLASFYACATHLASTSAAVALEQCRYLMDTAIPAVRAREGDAPVILGGDFNLTDARAPDPQSCMPSGFVRTDDGARQDVVASTAFTVTDTRTIDMLGTTDHPGLLVDLALAPGRSRDQAGAPTGSGLAPTRVASRPPRWMPSTAPSAPRVK
jgi:endonuclease/exonuclease/phosphatase family metal-dependent hydrolase